MCPDLHSLKLVISLAVIHCPFEVFSQQMNAKETYLIMQVLPEIRFGLGYFGMNPSGV